MLPELTNGRMHLKLVRAALAGAGITLGSLFGGLLLGLLLGSFVFDVLSGHSFTNPSPIHILLAALPALGGFLAGSAVWGIWMGNVAPAAKPKRMALAGALGFAPITLGLALLLQVLEPIAVERLGAVYPIHRLFTFFFVPTAFLIASVSAWALGMGLGNTSLALKLFWRIGLTAALTFLLTNLIMEAAGWQVGAPNADERATMLVVLFTGNAAAALVGGAVLRAVLVNVAAEAHPMQQAVA